MNATFEITHDRDFLQHFLTNWRTKSLSPEMVEKLKANKETDPYAAYGYGRWLSQVNPGGDCLDEAEVLLIWAGSNGVQDANAALAELYYEGRTKGDKSMPEMHAFLMDSSYKQGSELAQFQALENALYGSYGYREDPALVADILRGHLEKNPGADPIYYDLLGRALEDTDADAAEKLYRTAIERGELESYYSLANLYRKKGNAKRAQEVADEGAGKGAVNCTRFRAGILDEESFGGFPSEYKEKLHRQLAEELDFAIARHDSYACFLKAALLCDGSLGFPRDLVASLQTLERGCEMGQSGCYWLKAHIHGNFADELPSEKRLSPTQFAKTCLQAVRLGDRENLSLDGIAKGYVRGLLSDYAEEIEKHWLAEYVKAYPEEEDTADSTGVVAVYPQGFYYAKDVESEEDMDFNADVVHFSPVLTRLTKALSYDKEGLHIAMLVEKDGYLYDLPDNMTGTIVYGKGAEIRGIVIFVLEDDKDYSQKPFTGLQHIWMFLQLLTAVTDGLVRQPTSEELEEIGAPEDGGFEEYDDPDLMDEDDDDSTGWEQEIEEDMVTADTSAESAEPKDVTISSDRIQEGMDQCNLCRDTLIITYPNTRDFWFLSTEDLFRRFRIKSAVEDNIKRHGGYMIDEWQYVDERQTPIDLRARVRFQPEEVNQ